MTWSIQSPRLSSSTSSLAENRAETPPFCLCLGYIPPGEPWVMESPTVATPSMWTFSFPPSSASAAGAGTRFTLPFVRWAELCQGRVGTVAQLPQPPSPPHCSSSHKLACRGPHGQWRVNIKGTGHPCLREHGQTDRRKLRPEKPLLAAAGDS